jgi:predicted methyltransferase
LRKNLTVTAVTVLLAATAISTAALSQNRAPVPPYVKSAIADTNRPQPDKDRDAVREPAEMLAFAGIRPGSIVAEMIPGGGYFTRIFSKAVGPTGHVYLFNNAPAAGRAPPGFIAIAEDPAYKGNVTAVLGPLPEMKAPKPVDVVWTSQNYHDLPVAARGPINKAAFAMLKPGGTYIVLDHSAIVGTGSFAAETGKHRIDENLVKLEVMQAGFKLVGENNILRNPTDPRTGTVFEKTLNRDTDQFILKFQKPR